MRPVPGVFSRVLLRQAQGGTRTSGARRRSGTASAAIAAADQAPVPVDNVRTSESDHGSDPELPEEIARGASTVVTTDAATTGTASRWRFTSAGSADDIPAGRDTLSARTQSLPPVVQPVFHQSPAPRGREQPHCAVVAAI